VYGFIVPCPPAGAPRLHLASRSCTPAVNTHFVLIASAQCSQVLLGASSSNISEAHCCAAALALRGDGLRVCSSSSGRLVGAHSLPAAKLAVCDQTPALHQCAGLPACAKQACAAYEQEAAGWRADVRLWRGGRHVALKKRELAGLRPSGRSPQPQPHGSDSASRCAMRAGQHACPCTLCERHCAFHSRE